MSGSALPTDRRFDFQREESSVGLVDFNARFYSPLLGRFISPDSIVFGAGNPQASNRYAFVFNNPLKFTDPSGHRACQNRDDCYESSETPNGSHLDDKHDRGRSAKANLVRPKLRIFFLNAIGLGDKPDVFGPDRNPKNWQGYEIQRLSDAAGIGNVQHIPVYWGQCGSTTCSRFSMLGEVAGIRSWSPYVADQIAAALTVRPLTTGEKLILVGESGGGTLAVAALDLLAQKGIYVDQVIARGSPIGKLSITNVGRLDYITTGPRDYYYSVDINPFDIPVNEHRFGEFRHVPQTYMDKALIGQVMHDLVQRGGQ